MGLIKISTILTIIMVSVSLYSGFYMATATAFPQNPGTYAYFEKICNQPHEYHKTDVSSEYFWTYGGDCDERAQEFKKFVQSKGGTNIQTATARNVQNGKLCPAGGGAYGHIFVIWDGKVYNPSLNKTVRRYNADLDEYKELLKTEYYGLNTLYYENGTVEQL